MGVSRLCARVVRFLDIGSGDLRFLLFVEETRERMIVVLQIRQLLVSRRARL